MTKLQQHNSGESEAVRRLFIETYGCQMNVADSEVVASVMGLSLIHISEPTRRP